jgi:hypothetical protein
LNPHLLLSKRDFETDPPETIRPETRVFRSESDHELGWHWMGLDPVWWRAGTVLGTVAVAIAVAGPPVRDRGVGGPNPLAPTTFHPLDCNELATFQPAVRVLLLRVDQRR